jgi:hypothetical protein
VNRVSKNQACVKPSASAFCAIFYELLAVGMPTPKSMTFSVAVRGAEIGQEYADRRV